MTPSCTSWVNQGVAPGSQLAEASGVLADPRPDRLRDGVGRARVTVGVQEQAQPAGALGKAREPFGRHYIAGVQRNPGEHGEGQIPDRRGRRSEKRGTPSAATTSRACSGTQENTAKARSQIGGHGAAKSQSTKPTSRSPGPSSLWALISGPEARGRQTAL